jgi:hypothetical protein
MAVVENLRISRAALAIHALPIVLIFPWLSKVLWMKLLFYDYILKGEYLRVKKTVACEERVAW